MKTAAKLKTTPLYDRHAALKAKMVEFAGYKLPIQYTAILEEHKWVRSSCGIFDVSHLGEIRIKGAGAFPFVQKLIPSDLEKIGDNQIMYSVFLNEQGGIMDDIMIYRESLNSFLVIVNAGGIAKVLKHIESHAPSNVRIENESCTIACVALQGSKAEKIMSKLAGSGIKKLKFQHFKAMKLFDEKVLVSRTGYTGEDGFEIFADNRTIVKVWDFLMEKGEKLGVKPCGLGARNTLRLEVGNALYGHDLDETKTPFESRLQWLVSKHKEQFIGRTKLFERKKAGFRYKLIGFKVLDRAVAREGYTLWKDDRKVGRVTSGSFSPTLKQNIGLGYVETMLAVPGEQIQVEIHGRRVDAEVVKLPFVLFKHKG